MYPPLEAFALNDSKQFTDKSAPLDALASQVSAINLEAFKSLPLDDFPIKIRVTPYRIQKAVCDEFRVTLTDMTSKRRARVIARPRQVAMYLSKKLTKRSLPDIGRRFGGRDHTTVMHAVKRVDTLRSEDPSLNAQIELVESNLKG